MVEGRRGIVVRFLFLLAIATLVFSVLRVVLRRVLALLLGTSRPTDRDTMALLQLQRSGSDVTKAHECDFFLYFPSEAAAISAAAQIRERGFEALVSRATGGGSWRCLASRRLVPTRQALARLRADFEAIARPLGGEYEGWGAPAVR
jgi:hypothetical protein